MPTIEIHLTGLEETAHFGALLARLLRPGDLLLLSGGLGAGKTTLVRSVAVAMGVDPRTLSSPTFTIAHEHPLPGGGTLVHMDAYRLAGDDDEELDRLGWDRLATGDSITLIEWGERVADLISREPARLEIAHEGETDRAVRFAVPGSWTERPEWAAAAHLAGGSVFATPREQMADLYRWLSEGYAISRPLDPDDILPDEA